MASLSLFLEDGGLSAGDAFPDGGVTVLAMLLLEGLP